MITRILLILAILLSSVKIYASHAAGMDISYECISQGTNSDTYRITVKFYRDCSGNAGVYYDGLISYSSSCGSGSTTLNQIGSPVTLNPQCATYCNGGSALGVEEYTYQGNITLSRCSNWTISACEFARNAAINTINNPGGEDLCVQATLNNTTFCNNSPTFSQYPTPFICAGNYYCYNNGAIEIDGDSLVYSLITPLNTAGGGTISYIAPYSPSNPVGGGSSFDPQTGNLCVTPPGIITGVLAIRVSEYRNGILIGSIIRDIQINTFSCNTTIPPSLSAINDTNIVDINTPNTYTIELDCPDGTQNINFNINTINNNNSPPPGNEITVSIDTDNYGGEMTWNITNSSGVVVSSGGPYPNSSQQTYTITECLPSGTYTFNWYDSWGDGWCCTYGFGGYTVNQGNATLTSGNPSSGTFGSSTFFVTNNGPSCSSGNSTITMSWNNGIPSGNFTILNNNSTNPTGTFNWTPNLADTAGSPYFFTVDVTNDACPAPGNFSFQYQVILNNNETSSSTDTTVCGTYSWPLNNQTYNTSGTYTDISTNAAGCTHTETLNLTINNSTASTDNVGTHCDSYTWIDGITYTASNNTATFTSTNAAGCTHTETLNLTIEYSTSNTTTVTECDTYTWAVNNQTYNTSGIYTDISTNAAGCTHTETLNLVLGYTDDIDLLIDKNNISCFGYNDGSIVLNPNGGTPPYQFLWDNGSTSQGIISLSAGNYPFTITDFNGCALDSLVIIEDANQVFLDFTAISPICRYNESTLSIKISNSLSNSYTISLQDSILKSFVIDTNGLLIPEGVPIKLKPNFSGKIIITSITDNAGCTAVFNDDVHIEVKQLPIVNLNEENICVGDSSYTLNNATPLGGTYFINDVMTDYFDVQNIQIGDYNIRYEYTDPITSCYNEIEEVITVNESPKADFMFSPQLTDLNNADIFFRDNSNDLISSIWDLGDGTIIYDDLTFWHTYIDTGEYIINYNISNQFGCTDSLIKKLVIHPIYKTFIPTVFTPNNDGDNDYFYPSIIGGSSYNMKIYNRWGEIIYNEDNKKWDGTLNDNLITNGLYSYSITVLDFKEKPFIYTGLVTLIR